MPPVPATEQLRRLLVMVPWLIARGRVPLAEVAAAFGISEKQAEADVMQASMLGPEPRTPYELVNVFLDDDGFVEAFPGQLLTRPPQLSAVQGFALLAAAKGLLDYSPSRGDGPLGSAVAKLEAVLGDADVVDVDLQSPSHLDVVRDAANLGRRLRIVYFSAYRDEVSERDVDPRVVYQRHGRWYVEAWCHRAQDIRHFRVDRMREAAPTGETFEPVRAEPPPDVWEPGPDAETVIVDIPKAERWVIEAYPVEWEERGDAYRVTMRVLGIAWLERLLLKLGPAATVIEPASMRTVGRDAAARLLAAYG